MPFDTNVFINCPFDEDYKPLLRAIIFTTVYAELAPRICTTKSSNTSRVQQIKDLISSSKYGIHDLSRSRPAGGAFPRFNMPFELGIDVGCLTYGNEEQKEKILLIMETEQFYYHRVLSDISGQDIFRHQDDPKLAISGVRDWLVNNGFHLPGANRIWFEFNQFKVYLQKNLHPRFTLKEIKTMPEAHYIPYVRDWLAT